MFISKDNTLHINQSKNKDIDFESLIPELNQEKVQTTIDTVKYSLEEILKIKEAIDKYLYDLETFPRRKTLSSIPSCFNKM